MKGVQDKRHKEDLQVLAPFPGCLGRVINMLDLSNGVVATKMLTEKAHRDVSPAGKDRINAFKTAINPPAQSEDKQRDCQARRNSPTKRSHSPTKRSGGTPVKMLMEQDMWKEGMPNEEPLNVVARLMGLNDTPVQQSDFISGGQLVKEYRSHAFEENSLNLKPKKESKYHQGQKAGTRQQYSRSGFHEQPAGINSNNSKYQLNEPCCEKRMSLVREKFAEAKRLATDEKLLHSKEFQDALQFLSSNRDLFLEFLDEPNPLLSSNHYEFQPLTQPSEVKQITILKPSESMKRKGNINVGRQLFSGEDASEHSRFRHHQSLDVSPTNSNLSEPTRIVVLKPGVAKPHDAIIPRSPLSSAEDSENDSMMAVDETVRSRRLAKEITWQMRMRLKDRQDEENMISGEYPDFYIGDDSFSKSEVEIEKEESGETSEDLEFGTPTSGRSWDFLSRSGSPYSASCSSQTSHRREPSVVREGKKKILERWSMVSTVSSEEEREARKSTGTLGEMLTIPKVRKHEDEVGGTALETQTPGLESEEPFSCLPRSRSVPVSLSYGGIESSGVASGSQETGKERIRKSSSFRDKVSSLFSKNKKSGREKVDQSINGRLKHEGAVTSGDLKEGSNYLVQDKLQKQDTCLTADGNSVARLVAGSCLTNDMLNISTKDISSISSLGTPGIFGEPQDQPSPVSVLDGPFLCDNKRSLLYSSENFVTASPQALSRSPLIGSFSRSLSWEDPPLEVMSPNSLRLSRLFSKADEDLDSLTFIQKLVRSSGMDREGCILSEPLDPKLLERLSDQEGVHSREKRSRQRLLFDAVNEALAELTSTAELASYSWGRSCSLENRDCKNGLSNSAAEEIWRVIRNWSVLDKYPPGEVIERNVLLDMILKRELAVAGSADRIRLEIFELNAAVCAMVLEDLVEETLVDLTNN
ncbi:hypothetical protein ACP4OV_000047 [Aristida adscensionis]